MIFRPRARNGERGEGYLEFLIVFPLVMLLILAAFVQAWWQWNQSAAVVSLHQGVAEAAESGGSVEAGYDETMHNLRVALGRTARTYEDTIEIRYLPQVRITEGRIENEYVVTVPIIGRLVLPIRASSVQRTERFYAGPPEYYE
jgi:hypothetical protein